MAHSAMCSKWLAISLAVLTGCQPQVPADLTAMKIELTALKREFEYLRDQTEELDPRVRFSEQLALQAIDDREAPSPLDCLTGHLTLMSTRLTALPTVCEGVKKVPNGYRLRLKVGNPTAARIEGLRITVYAGQGAVRGMSEKRTFSEQSVSMAAGAWTPLDIDFFGMEQAELNEMSIRTQIDRIALGPSP